MTQKPYVGSVNGFWIVYDAKGDVEFASRSKAAAFQYFYDVHCNPPQMYRIVCSNALLAKPHDSQR